MVLFFCSVSFRMMLSVFGNFLECKSSIKREIYYFINDLKIFFKGEIGLFLIYKDW